MASLLLRRLSSIRCMTTTIKQQQQQPPWLMLPPKFKGGDMIYNFYSLSEDRVFTFNKRRVVDSDEIPPDDAKLVGSSHGWLASFDENSNHVFLSNPISGRHVKLPAIDTLPDPHINLFEGRGSVSRVILSSSPEEEGSHAILTFGPGRRLAFCGAGAGREWTPLGDALSCYKDEEQRVKFARLPWEDLAYCTNRREFITIQPLAFDSSGYPVEEKEGMNEHHCQMFHWKLPEGALAGETRVAEFNGREKKKNIPEETQCIQMPHIVCDDRLSALPLLVLRFLHRGIGDNASPSDPKLVRPDLYRAWVSAFPYRSVGFVVLKSYDTGIWGWEDVEDLKGMALFVGMNHSFAIPATGKLKANSIYFTDAGRITPLDPDHAPMIYGGHDIGIFDYEKKTISPCYYPCDFQSFKRIHPAPMWFTPSFT